MVSNRHCGSANSFPSAASSHHMEDSMPEEKDKETNFAGEHQDEVLND